MAKRIIFSLFINCVFLLCSTGHTGHYIKALFSTSLIFLLAHVSFQICLYTIPSLDDELGHNFFLTSRSGAAQLAARLRATAQHFLRNMGRILAITLLALAGITLPSAFSAFYFLLFIGVCTWWACHFPISHLGFNALCVMVAFFTWGHLVCLYLYQSSFAQDMFSPAGLWARLFGLKDIIKPGNCSSFDITFNMEHDWPVYVNPGILLLLYISVTIVLKINSYSHGHTDQVLSHIRFQHDIGRAMYIVHLHLQKIPVHLEVYMYVSELVMFVCAGPSGEAAADNPLHLVGRMILQQSYICALIAMMVWSITYHSWLTFVLLLWSCVIWMLRARQHFATLCSPFILLYGLALCCLQYVWALDLETELPQHIGTMSLHQLGLDRAQYPCLRLGATLLFTLTFWLLLRQSVKDMFSRKKRVTAPLQEVTTGESTGRNESILKVFGGLVMSLYAKYWIYVCGGMFIMVSFAGKLVAYKIIYMLLFLLCLCLYQVYYSLWRRLLKAFWWMVVAYTMVVLIAIYTFQFEDFPGYWGNFTGFTEQQLTDMGLETFKLSELFSSILIPGFFLLACILQLHYFHKPFMKITDLENVFRELNDLAQADWFMLHMQFEEEDLITEQGDDPSEVDEAIPSKWGLVMDRLMVLSMKFSDTLTHVQSFIWRVLELHIVKIVAFFVVWVALLEPSAMNLVLVVLWSFAMPYGRFRAMASCLSTIWVCVIIVCKMLYQLSVVNPAEYSNNCTVPMVNETSLELDEVLTSTLYKAPVDPANWFGVRKDATVLGYTKGHLLVLMLLVFEATVYRHQIHHYRQQQCSPPPIPVIFPQATRDTLDKGLLHCIKYLLNYSFYKFGLEICFLMTMNVIGQRMNFLVIIHGCWLVAIMVQRRRAAMAKIWSKYCLFLVVFMIYQYVLCVGIPPALCIDYPWRWKTSVTVHSALVKWIYLPDFYTIPNSRNLISDFLLLMCASQQWAVFENEKKEEWMVMGGENKDKPDPMEDMPFNPAPNFINCRSYLDMAKVLVFRYMFWFVLSVVFVTGATRISVFGLGYLMACFFFLLFGTRLLIKPSRTRLVMWDCLIMYNVAVIISKNILSILACVFVLEMQKNFCWVIQLFSLVCTVKGYYDPNSVFDKECSLPVEEAGIIWDSICFFFLLLQRRVFLSFHFVHVTADLQASARQASQGFELFRASIIKNMHFHQQAEKKSIQQLKESMKRIRDKQQKYKEGRKTSDIEEQPSGSNTGFVVLCSSAARAEFKHEYDVFVLVLNSGEYYMFESDSGEEDESFPEEQKPRQQTAFQLAYQAWVSSAKEALKDRQQRQREQRAEAKKQQTSQEGDDAGEQTLSSATGSDIVQKILDILKFLWVLFLAMVDGFTMWLNLLTKQYVDTSMVLSEERYLFIHNISQVGNSLTQTLSNAVVELETLGGFPKSRDFSSTTLSSEFTLELDTEPFYSQHTHRPRRSRTASELISESREFYSSQNRLLKLLFALYNVLAAHSELVCYFIIVLNNLVTASVISLVLPILVFLWAMLSVPRPSKRFWMTAIIYTEVMVVVKYLFQFGFFPWNTEYELKLNEDKPFFPPRILGLEKTNNFIRYDLLQLLALFFHRSLLQVFSLACSKKQKTKKNKPRLVKLFQMLTILKVELKHSLFLFKSLPIQKICIGMAVTFKEPKKKKKKKSKKCSEDTSKKRLNAIGGKLKGLFLSIVKNVYKPTCGFFQNILHAEYRAATDVYALMFLTDMVDFIIIIFGFWAFGKYSAAADIASSLSEDQVPEAFLVMLLIQFSTMIIDRALYLRKSILGKLIFQVILVFGIHLWMFFILPAVTERMFNHNSVAQLWYFFKCIYFTLSKYPQPKGQKKKKIVKYGMGGIIILFLICIIWFPLLFISLVKSVVGVVNHPVDVTVTVKLGGYEPLFTMSVQQQSIQPFTEQDYNHLSNLFGKNAVAMQFITMYSYEDIVTANIEGSSGSVWRISPPSRQELIKELLGSTGDMTLRLDWNFQRDLGKGGTVEHTFDRHSISLSPKNPVRVDLASLLLGTRKDPVHVPHMFPNYIRAPTGAEAKPVSQLYDGDEEGYQDVTLSLMREASVNTTGAQEWWDISIADCKGSCDVLPMVIFNDKVSPPSLGFLAGYGIMGLYVSVVLVIGKFVRGFFSEISHSIMFEELPCVDRILKLCMDIFLVRETGELEQEEELYSKLIFLYRSPETMIKWTREKNED
uniref:Piezo-type mechanosensitive ion channel component 1-like n=1 Tax=Sinocyclocheilus anshuiensis TaxID=1608454 RepID=A0A671QYV4_9TELE